MSNSKTIKRLEELYNVLSYGSDVDTKSDGIICVFKTGERICINQERGALFSQISFENNDSFFHEVREYEVSPELAIKIKLTLEKIKSTNWNSI